MLCQKFHGFLYQIKTPLNSLNLIFQAYYLEHIFNVINKTPNKYKIVEIGIRINMLESFQLKTIVIKYRI